MILKGSDSAYGTFSDVGERKNKRRDFNFRWQHELQWLKHETCDNGDEVVYCEVCRAAHANTKYASGIKRRADVTPNWRISSLRKHGRSVAHFNCIAGRIGDNMQEVPRYPVGPAYSFKLLEPSSWHQM